MGQSGLTEEEILRQQKNEETTKLKYITPILLDRWGEVELIVMEYFFTDGRIQVEADEKTHRESPKKADYFLLHKTYIPLAIVEAKGVEHAAEEGYQQAIEYAILLDVPFAYATNGCQLIERDLVTGKNRVLNMTDFPTHEELWERYKAEKGLTPDVEDVYLYPYYADSSGRSPRYYQRIAINRTVEAIASGQERILLVMATGTGKTYTAFQIIYRFWKTKRAKKILFLADRNILVDQTMKNDFKPFEKVMTKIEGKQIKSSYEIYLSLYQQLKNADHDYYKQLPPDFFDLILIDECHRGSASESSIWHDILQYFQSAIQIGLTATPKETEDTSNIAYFGEPIYTYSLKQGIEDGFLAPYRVISVELDLDREGYLAPENTFDITGHNVSGQFFEQKDFDRTVIISQRRELVAKRIADFIKSSGNSYLKTIVFCETIAHASAMQRLLENEFSELVAKDWNYVVKITGDDEVGKEQLKEFIKPSRKVPCIAVTSKLMGTGVDSQTCELIVLDRTIGSMTEFKQIIGRGTRIKEDYQYADEETIHSKTFFTILDFRKNYLKFSDPEFDGEPASMINLNETDEYPRIRPFPTTDKKDDEEIENPSDLGGNRTIVVLNGVSVEIINEVVQFLDENGQLIRENLESCVKNNILTQFPTADEFKHAWLQSLDKTLFAEELLLSPRYREQLISTLGALDEFDLILHIAYQAPIKTRLERIQSVETQLIPTLKNEHLKTLIQQLLQTYLVTDFETIKDPKVFNLPQFTANGWSTVKAMRLIGGKAKHTSLLNQIQNLLYEGEDVE